MKDFKRIYEEEHAQHEKTLSELTKHVDAMLKKFRFHNHEHERELCHALDVFIRNQRRLSYEVQLDAIATVQMILRERSDRPSSTKCNEIESFLSSCKTRTTQELIDKYDYAFSELKESLSDVWMKEKTHHTSGSSTPGT
jgi:hypothetical protein